MTHSRVDRLKLILARDATGSGQTTADLSGMELMQRRAAATAMANANVAIYNLNRKKGRALSSNGQTMND